MENDDQSLWILVKDFTKNDLNKMVNDIIKLINAGNKAIVSISSEDGLMFCIEDVDCDAIDMYGAN